MIGHVQKWQLGIMHQMHLHINNLLALHCHIELATSTHSIAHNANSQKKRKKLHSINLVFFPRFALLVAFHSFIFFIFNSFQFDWEYCLRNDYVVIQCYISITVYFHHELDFLWRTIYFVLF